MSINQVTIDGRLVDDVELRFIQSGQAVANFRIAHNDRIKQGDDWVDDEPIFDRVAVWGKKAETLVETVGKGDLVIVIGRRKARSWDKDGQKQTVVEIVADEVGLLRKKALTSPPPPSASDDPWASDAAGADEPPF